MRKRRAMKVPNTHKYHKSKCCGSLRTMNWVPNIEMTPSMKESLSKVLTILGSLSKSEIRLFSFPVTAVRARRIIFC